MERVPKESTSSDGVSSSCRATAAAVALLRSDMSRWSGGSLISRSSSDKSGCGSEEVAEWAVFRLSSRSRTRPDSSAIFSCYQIGELHQNHS